jgi:hypothetical protein
MTPGNVDEVKMCLNCQEPAFISQEEGRPGNCTSHPPKEKCEKDGIKRPASKKKNTQKTAPKKRCWRISISDSAAHFNLSVGRYFIASLNCNKSLMEPFCIRARQNFPARGAVIVCDRL